MVPPVEYEDSFIQKATETACVPREMAGVEMEPLERVRAPAIFPVVHVPPDMEAVFPLPEESEAVEPEPSSSVQYATWPEFGKEARASWEDGAGRLITDDAIT